MINSNVSRIDWTEVGLYVPVAAVVRSVAGTLSLLGPTTLVVIVVRVLPAPQQPSFSHPYVTHQMFVRFSLPTN